MIRQKEDLRLFIEMLITESQPSYIRKTPLKQLKSHEAKSRKYMRDLGQDASEIYAKINKKDYSGYFGDPEEAEHHARHTKWAGQRHAREVRETTGGNTIKSNTFRIGMNPMPSRKHPGDRVSTRASSDSNSVARGVAPGF